MENNVETVFKSKFETEIQLINQVNVKQKLLRRPFFIKMTDEKSSYCERPGTLVRVHTYR